MATMAERLEQAMQARGIAPRDVVARKILSKAGIYFILDGTTTPEKIRDSTVTKLCQFLRINREWLKYGKGQMDAAIVFFARSV